MEPDFPTLDISVGAYYQLLKENRGRVTRQKTAALTDKKKEPHPEEKRPTPPPKPAKIPRPKKPKDPEPAKKRPVPEEPVAEEPVPKPVPKKPKKSKDEQPHKRLVKESSKEPVVKSKESAIKPKEIGPHKYSQKLPDGVFRENVLGRIACLKRKAGAQATYIKFVESVQPKGESYIVEVLDPENLRKSKDPPVKETISLKQEKVYLVMEPAWLLLGCKDQRYQPVLVLLNIGRTDIEDLQLPDQPFPADYKTHMGETSASKQSIFSTEQRVLIMNPETLALSKCSTDLLFQYTPSADAALRQDSLKKSLATLKQYTELDYLSELNQKWLHDNEEVEVTKENAKECLFSEVTFKDRRGVLLSFHPTHKGLCIRVYAKNGEPVPAEIEWVYLDVPESPKIHSNMLKGRVTLVELEAFDPSAATSASPPQYKYCEIQEDEDPKAKPEQKEIELKRCKQCNYVIDKLESRDCARCGEYFHRQCLSEEAAKVGMRDRQWRCMNCVRCAACLSGKDPENLVTCTVCNTGYHMKCMEPDVFNQMPSSNKGKISWKCDKCVKCTGCGTRSAGHSKHSKWSYDYSLCSKCKKKKVNNQYCPVCEQIWNSTEEEPMIQCACGMWVHKSCDKSLTDDAFNNYENTGKEYLCMKCRRNKRNMFIMQIIDILANEDKMQLFHQPVDLLAVPNYANVIKQPMCFKTMREKASQGTYLASPESLKGDFELICKNAMTFNMPKTNYYKEAESLLTYGNMILNNNWATLQKFKTLTQEEETYAKQMVEKKRVIKSPVGSPVVVPSKLKSKPTVILEEDKEESEEVTSSKILRKALRKRRVINYSEDQQKEIEAPAPPVPEIAPVIPPTAVRRRKIGTKKAPGQPPVPKKETGPGTVPEKTAEKKPEGRAKDESGTIQGYFEMLAQREEEASKYLYSNPVVAQFNDPTLCFAEMCSLCGAFGNSADFIMCVLCGESYHPYCISLPAGVDLEKLRKYWKCLNCKYCEHCCKATGEDKLLYCDSCDKAYHTYCLTPPLKVIPGCGWKCKDCFKCAKCGTQAFFGDHGSTTETIYDYTHTNNFTYCNKCGMEEHDKSFCSICKELGGSTDNPLAYCSVCKRCSHIKCSRITPNQYEDLIKSKTEFKCFTCSMKERSSQEIHYEVCEAYLNIHNISYRHSMLNDFLHVALKRYLTPLDADHASSLLAAFAEENQEFFRTDPDINRFLALQESHVAYEEGTSTITSPTPSVEGEERPARNQEGRLELFSRRAGTNRGGYGKEIKDLLEISKDCVGKEQIKMTIDEGIIGYVLAEGKDAEWEKVAEILKENSAGEMVLSPEAKYAINVQKLRKIYGNFGTSLLSTKSFDEYKTTSTLEATETAKHKVKDSAPFVPSILANIIQASIRPTADRKLEPMVDLEEQKERNISGGLKVPFDPDEKYTPKGINDTFLPDRWNVYTSLYKPTANSVQSRPKYRQGKHFEEYMDMIDISNDDTADPREKRMRVEVSAVLKLQQTFHQWMYHYVKNKVQELKKSLHDKSSFEKVLAGKRVEETLAAVPMEIEKKVAENVCGGIGGDPAELDPVIENPEINLVCCLCKQNGERKLSGRLIPFQGALYVHVNCALWSTEVFETNDGALINFAFAYKRSKGVKCVVCGKGGASLSCNAKKYHANYHFICAVSQQMAFISNKSAYCKQCAKTKGVPLGFPPELNQKRRLYISKTSTLCNSMNDLNKPGILERWRPFGYESFNRIGNLTVIKLNKRLDKVLAGKPHEAHMLGELDGYVSLRIFWNIYDFHRPEEGLPFYSSKAYYLCSGSSTGGVTVKAYPKPSINILKPHMPHYLILGRTPEIDPAEALSVAEKEGREMWNEWLIGVKRHLPKFTLENIAFNANEFVGTTKFPVSAWHSLNAKNADVVLISNAQPEQTKPAPATSKKDPNAPKQNYAMFVGELREEVFDMIIRMNDEIGTKTAKYVAYKRAQASPFMGKIGVRDAGPSVPPQNPAKLPKRGKPKEILYESKNVKTNVKDVDLPIAMKYRNYRHMPKKIEVAPSRIHKNGLFATDDFLMGEIVVEYVGELIRNKVADKREKIYEARGFGDCYMFRIDKDMIVDATMYGSKARYLNHCCSPNCSAKVNVIHGTKHIIIYANKHIKAGEELTYDYQFDVEAEKIQCNCGAPNCQGRLN